MLTTLQAAMAGGLLGAQGLTPPDSLGRGLRCGQWWRLLRHPDPPLWPVFYTFVHAAGASVPPPGTPDLERDLGVPCLPLPPFDWEAVDPGLWLGRSPLFANDVWDLARWGVTHLLDPRDPASGRGRAGTAGWRWQR